MSTVTSPPNLTPVTRSRSVPVITRSLPGSTTAGEYPPSLTAGFTSTYSPIAVSLPDLGTYDADPSLAVSGIENVRVISPLLPERVNDDDCTSAPFSFIDLMRLRYSPSKVTVSPALNKGLSSTFSRVPVIEVTLG